MAEVKDQAIKLFGKTIPLTANEVVSAATSAYIAAYDMSCKIVGDGLEENKKPSESDLSGSKQENCSALPTAEDPATTCENPLTPSADKETLSTKASNNEEQSETSNSEDKTLKKPDKIIPCPRCNSMDTKFCYYNNYNVNQPRHFCKNCQRYWTAGGTMRNVPVGSGRRKNKTSSASHYNHIMVSNGIHHPSTKTHGTVLAFGSDSPLCESMASALNLAEKSPYCGGRDIGEEQSCGSSITASNSSEKGVNGSFQESVMNHFQGFPPQVPCFPTPPWPCPYGPPGFPVSFYQTPPYWGCALPVPWNMPHSSPNSPTLGKHSRDGHILNPSNSEKEEPSKDKNSERCVLIPKTLRIDDPSEAAKSSIWSTLGIKNETADSISGGRLFKAFQSKDDEKNHIDQTSLMLQANPAALSRSLNFHEST